MNLLNDDFESDERKKRRAEYARILPVLSVFCILEDLYERVFYYGKEAFEEEEIGLALKEWENVLRGRKGDEPGNDIGLTERGFIKVNIPFLYCPDNGHLAFKVLMDQVHSNFITPEKCKEGVVGFFSTFSFYIRNLRSDQTNFAYNKIGIIRLLLFILHAYKLPINGQSLKMVSSIVEETLATKSYKRIEDFLNNPSIPDL